MNDNNKKIVLQELQTIANKTSSKDDKEKSVKKIQNILDEMKKNKDIIIQNQTNKIQSEIDILKKEDATENDKNIAFNKIIILINEKQNNKTTEKLPDIGLGFVNSFFTSFVIFFYFYAIRIILALSNPPIFSKKISKSNNKNIKNKINEILNDGSFSSKMIKMISSLKISEDNKIYKNLVIITIFYALITSLVSMTLSGKKSTKFNSFLLYFMGSSWLPPILLIGLIIALYNLCKMGFSKIDNTSSAFKIKFYVSILFIFLAIFGLYNIVNFILMVYTRQWFFLFTPIICTITFYIVQDVYENFKSGNTLITLLKYILTPILIIIPYFIFTIFNYVS